MKEPRQTLINLGATLIAIFVCCVFGYAVKKSFEGELPINNRDIAMVLVGVIVSEFRTITAFFFSSTSKEKKQSDTIEKQAATIQSAQAALNPNGNAPTVKVADGEKVTVEGKGDA